MIDLIVTLIVLALVIPAISYIVRARKRGERCIGCPSGSKCCGGSCGECRHGNCVKENCGK